MDGYVPRYRGEIIHQKYQSKLFFTTTNHHHIKHFADS